MADGIYINRYPVPVTTGITLPQKPSTKQPKTTDESSFAEILEHTQRSQTAQINFSRHAQSRIADRGIDIGDAKLERLSEGMRLAGEKGLDGTLILVDKTAFIVSVKNGTVVTTLNGDDLNGNVFTNIEGTVII
ncbi:MAG: TIGR02530 family flagellar biosynthesis protein [Acetanaerobacterium sp.]